MVLKPRDPPGHSFVGMQWLGKIFLSIIIAIAAGSAPVRWPDIDSCTCLLQPSVAQQRSQYQVTERLHQGKRRRCKTPQNHHTNRFIHQQQQLPPPRRSKWKTCFSECHRSGKPPPPRPLDVPEHAREKKIGINSPPQRNFCTREGPLVYNSSTMGKSKKPAQTPRDREREYEALYRSVGLSSEEEGDSNG